MENIENKDMNTTTEPAAEKAAAPQAKAPAHPTHRPENAPTVLKGFVDDGNDMVEGEMPFDVQLAEVKRMRSDIQKGNICYGKVFAVEVTDNSEVRIIVKRDTIRVVIPDSDFFAHSAMKDIEQDDKATKFIRYRRKASHMMNAVISFIPKAIAEDEDGVPFVIASRKEAMDKLQQKHFFAANADAELGTTAKASIISSGPRYVTVECMGVESVIGTGGLSAFEYIEDASRDFPVGTGLVVAIEAMRVDKENKKVEVDFSHSLVERLQAKVECANERMINGRYIATVAATKVKDYYVVIIKGLKIRGLVPVASYAGVEPLVPGDEVVLLVTGVNKERNTVIGKCMKAN